MTLLSSPSTVELRERILETAYGWIGRHGLAGTDLGELAAAAGASLADIEDRFPDKQTLLLAAIEHQGHRWAAEIQSASTLSPSASPEQRLLALFDAYEEWFGRQDFNAAELFTVLSEAGRFSRTGPGALVHVERVRTMIATLAAEAGLRESEDFAVSCHLLLKGAIVSAIEGDRVSTRRAKHLASALIAMHHPAGEVHDVLSLARCGEDQAEWLVVSEGNQRRGEGALAIIRKERSGYTSYPNAIGYGRLGPFETLKEAYAAVAARMAPSAIVKPGGN